MLHAGSVMSFHIYVRECITCLVIGVTGWFKRWRFVKSTVNDKIIITVPIYIYKANALNG